MADRMTLNELVETARKVASELFRTDGGMECSLSSSETNCLGKEAERALTRAERSMGWARRPFNAYEHGNLCASCRAYWFQEMAAQTLHEMNCWKIREEALAKRG